MAKPIMEATISGATAVNEAADLLMSAVDAIENGPSLWHLVGILPGFSGTTMRKIDDAIDVARKMEKPIWSSTKKLDSVENAFTHWKNHGPEFPQFRNSKEYVEGANKFVTNPPSGTLTKTRSNGDKLFYNPSSNTFAVQSADGVPRTMFKPQDGIEYWNKQ